MCLPVVLGVASAAASYIGQSQAADAQEKSQRSATTLEQARYLDQVSAARVRQAQERISVAQRIGAASRGNLRAMARARVAAGEAGLSLSSLSVSTLVDDLTRRFATSRFSETQRQGMRDVNRNLAFRDIAMRSRMNLLGINKPIQQPSILTAALQGAQTGLSAASVMQGWSGGGAPTGADPGVSGGLSARPGRSPAAAQAPPSWSSPSPVSPLPSWGNAPAGATPLPVWVPAEPIEWTTP